MQDDNEYLESSLYLCLSAPSVPKYSWRILVKKDFSATEKLFDLGYELMENEKTTYVSTDHIIPIEFYFLLFSTVWDQKFVEQ